MTRTNSRGVWDAAAFDAAHFTIETAIRKAGGLSFYGREDAPGGPDDFVETQWLLLGPDRASERWDAR